MLQTTDYFTLEMNQRKGFLLKKAREVFYTSTNPMFRPLEIQSGFPDQPHTHEQ